MSKIIRFDNELELYQRLEEYLSLGYKISNTYGVSVELQGRDRVILTASSSRGVKEMKADVMECEIVYPDYNNSLLNVIADIRHNFGYDSEYNGLGLIDRHYNHIVLLILDGLGSRVIRENLAGDGLFNKNKARDLISIFPSTTACATTSIISGLTPIRTGWTGWENYIREIDRDIELFNGINYYTRSQTGVTGFKYMPYETFFSDMDIYGEVIQPDFTQAHRDITDVLKRSISVTKKHEQSVQYVYFTEPDSYMHKHGNNNEGVRALLSDLESKVNDYINELGSDTLVLISADHGHINTHEIRICDNDLLFSYLKRKPSNDARCITFSVKEECRDRFVELFNGLYSNIYRLYTKEEFIRLGFIGSELSKKHERIDDFLGDFIGVAISNYYFNYSNHSIEFKSHHAGMTKDEMEIPLICLEGGRG